LCEYYGLLYTAYSACDMKMWEGVQGICPDGWHVPTRKEWEKLFETIGGYSAAKELLPGGSTDFNALFAGAGGTFGTDENLDFQGREDITYFWSSTPLKPSPPAYSHWNLALIKGQDRISTGYSSNVSLFSVRCIKND
jgi:uncharacterized protein (TIGR02145 family)